MMSIERNAEKTTFLNWLNEIFQGNITINKNKDFKSGFNTDWAPRLIIAVYEVLLDKKEDIERLKNLSIAKSYKSEVKAKTKWKMTFYENLFSTPTTKKTLFT